MIIETERMHQQDKTEQQILTDIPGMKERVEEYKNVVRQADLCIVTFICSDSRVSLPQELVEIPMTDGQKVRAAFIGVPTIGGGLPSRSRVRGVISELGAWGVKPERLRMLVTQHGDTNEIDHGDGLSCGLRKFLYQNKEELLAIRSLLLPWSDSHKRKTGDITKAPDRCELSVLSRECPDILEKMYLLAEKTGVPTRLILRAAYRNGDFSIGENGEIVRRGISQYLMDREYKEILTTCEVGLAEFLCALAEASYAILHRLHPHQGDANFASLQDLVVVCDSGAQLSVIKHTLETEEFKYDFQPMMQTFNAGKFYVINLHAGTNHAPQLTTIKV